MAIDFMIMPMSRYISGDFVTPNMAWSWEQGIPYAVFGPDGRRDCPPGQPFGGPDAPQRRIAMLDMLYDDLEKLPATIVSQLWDERAPVEPRFHRVDPTSYRTLLDQAQVKKDRPSFLGFLKRRQSATFHVTATLFLPCDFDEVFEMSSPFERVTASAKRALEEVSSGDWTAETASARETLADALKDVSDLRLPMIVDW
jgi:hypothetical protein